MSGRSDSVPGMTDPLNDPRFADRPTHPDFWRISEALTWADGRSREAQQSVPEIIAGMVDEKSLSYASGQRAGLMVQALGAPESLVPLIQGAWLDAFIAGVRFQSQGGHREDPS